MQIILKISNAVRKIIPKPNKPGQAHTLGKALCAPAPALGATLAPSQCPPQTEKQAGSLGEPGGSCALWRRDGLWAAGQGFSEERKEQAAGAQRPTTVPCGERQPGIGLAPRLQCPPHMLYKCRHFLLRGPEWWAALHLPAGGCPWLPGAWVPSGAVFRGREDCGPAAGDWQAEATACHFQLVLEKLGAGGFGSVA